MSHRRQSSRRRSYAPRRHEIVEREARMSGLTAFRPGPDELASAAAADTAGHIAVAGLIERLAFLDAFVPLRPLAAD